MSIVESSTVPSVSSPSTTEQNPFAALGLIPALVRAVAAEGYTTPTPIQTQCIPHLLLGKDLLGCAQTGTGKTAAFVLPILQALSAKPPSQKIRALVLTPTRELAAQIAERATVYGAHVRVRNAVIFGGVGQRAQEEALRRGIDLLVATPGRLLDLMQQRLVRLDGVEHFVLDEADRMLDMGFVHDVRRVVATLPKQRQTLLFSATFPNDIVQLAQSILRDPVRVSVTPAKTTADGVEQAVYHVGRESKRTLLEQVLRTNGVTRTLVFTRTKHGANRVSEHLVRAGINSAAIHGNKSQGARERALEGFRKGTTPVLVATDIAARGIDVDGITHVINYDLPNVAESYVHRIGRTARAGASGAAISFCEPDDRPFLADIERLIRRRIPVAGTIAPQPGDLGPPPADDRGPRPGFGGRGRGGSSRGGGGGGGSRHYAPRGRR